MFYSRVYVMSRALRKAFQFRPQPPQVLHAAVGATRRDEVEDFIRQVFVRQYNARIPSFAPNLMMVEHAGRVRAAAGWRGAAAGGLYLERYLDEPVEHVLAGATGQAIGRERIVEVGNLASDRPGASMDVIRTLARHLDQLGYEWVVFTATNELIGIFRRLGLPLLALTLADPARLGEEASAWGSYYDTAPIVVAGRIRAGLGCAEAGAKADA